jgi:hypothetical protein
MSFNFEALALDVEACYTITCSNIVDIYGFVFEKNSINTSITNAKWHYNLFDTKFIIPL